jgi:hypothetical protein
MDGVDGLTLVGLVFLQLISYGPWPWLLFITVAFGAAYLLRGPGVFLGHLLIAAAIVVLDLQWIQAEMHQPGWTGQPDQDVVFIIGMLLRILLINTTLLPVSILALRLRRSRPSRDPMPQRTGLPGKSS